MTPETNKALTRKVHECFDKSDWEGMRSRLAAGFRAYAPGQPQALDIGGFEGLVKGFMAAFSQTRHVFEDQVAEADRVATRAVWSGIHSGSFNGIPATGRPVQMEIFMIDRFAGDKVIEHRASFDVMGLLAQVGAMPASS